MNLMRTVTLTSDFRVTLFNASEDYEAYRAFITLRHKIFGIEYLWKSITSADELPESMPEGFNRTGIYLVTRDNEGKTCAIGRGLHIVPDRLDFWPFIKEFPLEALPFYNDAIGTIMDIALPRNCRSRILQYRGRRMTLGQAVYVCLAEELALNAGVRVIMGYSSINGAQNFVRKLGAYLIGKPVASEQGSVSMICYIMVLDNKKRFSEKRSPMSILELKSDPQSSKIIDVFENKRKRGQI